MIDSTGPCTIYRYDPNAGDRHGERVEIGHYRTLQSGRRKADAYNQNLVDIINSQRLKDRERKIETYENNYLDRSARLKALQAAGIDLDEEMPEKATLPAVELMTIEALCDRSRGGWGHSYHYVSLIEFEDEDEDEDEIVGSWISGYSDSVIWACYEQSDKTEGRGPMVAMSTTYRTEQEAWDSVNHLPGVQGNRPENITWKSRKATSWQDFKAIDGLCGDYDVRRSNSLTFHTSKNLPASSSLVSR